MKITKVNVYLEKTPEGRPGWRPIFCRIYTDEGIWGDGEAAIAYGKGASASFNMIKELAPMIIGMNPLQNDVIWEKLYKGIFWGISGGPIIFSAIAAIDMALWDYVALTAMWILAMIPMLLHLSVTTITNMTQILVSLFSFLEAYAFLKMPKKYPKSWAASKLHVPNWLYYVFLALSTLVYCVTLWKACLSLNPLLAAANIIFVLAAYILGIWRGRTGNITLNTAVWPLDKSEMEQVIE